MEAHTLVWWVPLLVAMVVVAPVWIVAHYLTRWREARNLARADSELLVSLWESAQQMDERIHNLERILDAEAPHWRQQT